MSQEEAIEKIRNLFLEDYKNIKKKDERLEFIKKLRDIASDHGLESYKLFFSGFHKWLEKDFNAAIESFEKAITLEDKDIYAWNGLGNIYVKRNEYGNAVKAFKKSIALDDKGIYAVLQAFLWVSKSLYYILTADLIVSIRGTPFAPSPSRRGLG